MSIFNIIIIGIGLAMDAFAVTIAKTLSLKDIKIKEILSIAGLFGIFQGLMPVLGYLLGIKFESYITSFDHWIAFILLTIIGGKMLYEALGEDETNESDCEAAITNVQTRLPFKTLLLLAIATSIDALAVGVSFAFLNVSIIAASLIIAITTFLLCIIAVYVGKFFGGIMQKRAEIFGGIVLILIGLKILLEHIL